MSLPEQSLPTSVQRKHVDVFGRDAKQMKITSGTISFQCNMVLYACMKVLRQGLFSLFLLCGGTLT